MLRFKRNSSFREASSRLFVEIESVSLQLEVRHCISRLGCGGSSRPSRCFGIGPARRTPDAERSHRRAPESGRGECPGPGTRRREVAGKWKAWPGRCKAGLVGAPAWGPGASGATPSGFLPCSWALGTRRTCKARGLPAARSEAQTSWGASPRWSYLLAPQSQISAFQEGPNPRLTSWTSWGGAGTGLLRELVAGCGNGVWVAPGAPGSLALSRWGSPKRGSNLVWGNWSRGALGKDGECIERIGGSLGLKLEINLLMTVAVS